MSKDIRSFFSAVGGSKKKEDTPKILAGSNSKKTPKGTAKRLIVLSDSDDDDSIIPSSLTKRRKADSDKNSSNDKEKGSTPVRLVPKREQTVVNPLEIFGKEKVKRSAEVTLISTRIEQPAEVPKKKKKKKGDGSAPGWDESFSDVDFLSTLDQLDAIEAQATGNSANKATRRDEVESGPMKITEENGKTSLTLKIKGRALDDLQKIHSKSEKKSSKNESSEKPLNEVIEEVELPGPKKVKAKKGEPDSVALPEAAESCFDLPPEEAEAEEEPSWASDPAEKRRLSAIGYQRYLNREGPKHLGAKEIPTGTADCLKGLVFVITGVLDSLERDSAAQLVESCGGKVTSSVSRKTSYIVLGQDAGPSKVHKAQQCGTKQIDEDGLLDLIRAKSGIASASDAGKATEAGSPRKASSATKSSSTTKASSTTKSSPPPKASSTSKLSSATKASSPTKVSPGKAKETTSQYFDKSPGSKVSDKHSHRKNEPSSKKSTSGVDTKSFYGKTAPRRDRYESPSASSVGARAKQEDCVPAKLEGTAPKALQSAGSKAIESASAEPSLMWVDKYRPRNTKQIIGQQTEGSNMRKLKTWLQNWHTNQFGGRKIEKPNPWARNDDGAFFKAALLSGPPGVGKTTTAHLVCRELGLDVVEFNASDTRGKKRLRAEVGELLSSKSLHSYFQGGHSTSAKHVLVMDEVDGMAGNEDRGGITELMLLIKHSKVPVICMCNDYNHQKLRTFVTHCFNLKFAKPKVEQIRGAMMTVCFREGVKVSSAALDDMIVASSQDVRQILHHLSLYAAKVGGAGTGDSKQIKNIRLGPWDVLMKVFSAAEHKGMSMNDKAALFFFDYNLASLFVQENYLQVAPHSAGADKFKRLDLIAEAADTLCWGDVIEKTIRSRNDSWSLLPTQALFSSVIPGELLSGTVTGRINFPQWLGRNSTRNRHSRLEQELQAHTRLVASASRAAFNLDYLRPLRDALARPLMRGDAAGAVAVMQAYHLMRTDLDSIMDIGVWSFEPNPLDKVASKVKSEFTRTLNKEAVLLPYSQALGTTMARASAVVSAGDGDEEDAGEDEEKDDDDIAGDAMIKAKKPSAAKKPAAVKKPAAARRGSGKDSEAGGSKAKGRGKSK